MAVACARPYASLHLAPDRQPRQYPTTHFFTGLQTYQNKAKNLCTIYFVFDLGGECKFIKTKHNSD